MASNRLQTMTFWDHVDALRSVILRAGLTIVVMAVVFFIAMPWIFDNVILAPCRADFPFYRLLTSLSRASGGSVWMPDFATATDFHCDLINIQLASQFFIHMSTSFWLAVVISFPIVVYIIWGFISPGLYPSEKRGAVKAFLWGNVMFYLGVAVGYFIVFPLTLRFLAEYKVSDLVPNQISLDSYMDNFLVLILVMGIVFELPLVAWMLGRAGVLTRSFFSRFRRHAIAGLLILAAVITPTGDPFTLMVVFLPVYMLWELSGILVPPTSEDETDSPSGSEAQQSGPGDDLDSLYIPSYRRSADCDHNSE